MKKTVLRSSSGEIITVPNLVFFTGSVVNYTKAPYTKIIIPLSVPTGSNLEKIYKIIYNLCLEDENMLPHLPKTAQSFLSKVMEEPVDVKALEPKVVTKSITNNKLGLEIWVWIWDMWRKDVIISNFLNNLTEEFKKNKIG